MIAGTLKIIIIIFSTRRSIEKCFLPSGISAGLSPSVSSIKAEGNKKLINEPTTSAMLPKDVARALY